jgi:gamma-glutamylcysteine synthetase
MIKFQYILIIFIFFSCRKEKIEEVDLYEYSSYATVFLKSDLEYVNASKLKFSVSFASLEKKYLGLRT